MDNGDQDIDTIPRGADLTDDDIDQLVCDFIAIWARAFLQENNTPREIKQALRDGISTRLGRPEVTDG